MTRVVVVALALVLAAGARAQAPAALGNVDIESDTDGFHASRLRIGGLYPYLAYVDYVGAAVQSTHFSQGSWSRDAVGVVGLWRKQDAKTLTGVNAEAGVVQVAGHTRGVADVTWDMLPAKSTRVELIAAGDVVATRKAIERGIAYGFVAASVEQTLVEQVTAIALAGYQPFTDGNDRMHWRGRLIWEVVPDSGVTLQLRYRAYKSDSSDVDGAYFNPDRYRQWQGAVGVRRRVGTWIWTASAGAGRETVNGTDIHPVRMAEFRGEGALMEGVRLAVYALYSRSTGYVDAPDYAYRQVGTTLIYRF